MRRELENGARHRASPDESARTISAQDVPTLALLDLWSGLLRHEMWRSFAIHDIRQRFRRSVLGPLWLTLSMGIMVGALALVFGAIFQQPVGDTLPYIATGLIFWGLMTSCIIEGSTVFVSNEGYIRNVPMPLSVHLFRMLARNIVIWLFNMVIYVGVFVIFQRAVNWNYLLFVPAFALFLINIAWMSLASAILSTRFRDIPQVISSLIPVVFFLTPVFWSLETLPTRPAFVTFNPFHHLIEIVRGPLLGVAPSTLSWMAVIGMAAFGTLFTILLYRRAYPRIPYWV